MFRSNTGADRPVRRRRLLRLLVAVPLVAVLGACGEARYAGAGLSDTDPQAWRTHTPSACGGDPAVSECGH